MPAAEPIVRIGVVKEFGALRVLDGVGFDVVRGQTVAIVGRSGSGKSTLLRCIAGLETIQAGRIEVCGHEVGRPGSAARAQLRRDVGMVFQSYNLFPHLTVERNITLALTLVKKESGRRPGSGRQRCWARSASWTSSSPIPSSFRAASSRGSPSRARWRCRPRSCCSTR